MSEEDVSDADDVLKPSWFDRFFRRREKIHELYCRNCKILLATSAGFDPKKTVKVWTTCHRCKMAKNGFHLLSDRDIGIG
jgi:hypothetical protein